MPVFSKRSRDNLAQAHPDLQRIMHEAIKETDFTVICGYRNKKDQDQAFKEGKSRARFGASPHNFAPAYAVDIMPYPEAFKATVARWEEMTNVIVRVADRLGIKIKLGRDFPGLVDRPHFELAGWREMAKR